MRCRSPLTDTSRKSGQSQRRYLQRHRSSCRLLRLPAPRCQLRRRYRPRPHCRPTLRRPQSRRLPQSHRLLQSPRLPQSHCCQRTPRRPRFRHSPRNYPHLRCTRSSPDQSAPVRTNEQASSSPPNPPQHAAKAGTNPLRRLGVLGEASAARATPATPRSRQRDGAVDNRLHPTAVPTEISP